MKLLAVVLVVALAAAACADDDGAARDDADPTSTTSVVATSTTEATAPTVDELPACPDAEPLTEADIDGDGNAETVLITERDGGQALWVCGANGGRFLELEHSVWQLAVMDVEPDGVDELLLGTLENWGPAGRQTRFRLIEPSPVGLTAVGERRDWLSIGRGGADLVDVHEVALPAAACVGGRDGRVEQVDLDLDGRPDLVRQWQPRGETRLFDPGSLDSDGIAIAMCLASGTTDLVFVRGMGEIFGLGAGPGGAPLVWSGGTSVSAGYRSPLVLVDDRLTFVAAPDEDRFPFGLWDGYEGVDPSVGGRWGSSGCGDVDGNGTEEFFQVVIVMEGGELLWERETWSLEGATAASGPSDSGTLPLPADWETGGLFGAADVLAPEPC